MSKLLIIIFLALTIVSIIVTAQNNPIICGLFVAPCGRVVRY